MGEMAIHMHQIFVEKNYFTAFGLAYVIHTI